MLTLDDVAHYYDDYDVELELGHGASCSVFRARHIERGEICAMKVLADGKNRLKRNAFFEEAYALDAAEHPNVISMYERGADAKHPFIAMEFAAHGTLTDMIEDFSHTEEQVSVYAVHICRGVRAIHEAGYLHLDLKPSNIMLGHEYLPKIGDFGLAKHYDDWDKLEKHFSGEEGFIAPEALDGKVRVDSSTDVYAIGCVIYNLLTGESPTSLHLDYDKLDAFSMNWRWVIEKATSHDRNRRYGCVAALEDELTQMNREMLHPTKIG